MATGKAPVSGGIAIVCGLWVVTTVIIAILDGLPWTTVLSSLGLVVITVVNWRGFKEHDRQYRERMERLDRRLSGDS